MQEDEVEEVVEDSDWLPCLQQRHRLATGLRSHVPNAPIFYFHCY